MRSFAESIGNPAKASWYLELADRVDAGYNELPASSSVIEIVREEKLQIAATATVRKKLSELGKESCYWEWRLDRLCLEGLR